MLACDFRPAISKWGGKHMKERKFYPLSEYVNILKKAGLVIDADLLGKDQEIARGLTYDSRAVETGTVFICKGQAFKESYLESAVEKGAVLYVSENKYQVKAGEIPFILVNDIRRAMLELSNFFYQKPWEDLTVIGTGGTKGKTTTSYYIKYILDDYMEATGGKESGIMSSIDFYDGVNRGESTLTTPETVELQGHLFNAVSSGIKYMEMEVSSQALKYGRVANMVFDLGIFLNISEDHISPVEHKDFEDYFQSKLLMFQRTKHAIINLDCELKDRVLEAAKASEDITTFSLKDASADFYCDKIEKDPAGLKFHVVSDAVTDDFILGMPGIFNVENAMAAIAGLTKIGVPIEYIKSGLEKAKTRGRMEMFFNKKKDIVAIVDFAHNKLSFERIFQSAVEEYKGYEIRAVFGCPGGKAITRREDLATVASQYATKVYVTEDDPGPEDREDICKQIAEHVTCPYEIIVDRVEAIKKAASECKEKTVLMVLGKGDEANIKYENGLVDKPADTEVVSECLRDM